MAPYKKGKMMPEYNPTKEQEEWHLYCVRNNIRVSPGGLKNDSNNWTIDISLDGTTWNKSPKKYGREDIWETYYNICKYYYDKRK